MHISVNCIVTPYIFFFELDSEEWKENKNDEHINEKKCVWIAITSEMIVFALKKTVNSAMCVTHQNQEWVCNE